MRYTLSAVLYFITVIIIAHFFAPPGYVWTRNTISDLGSQGHVNKWIMQSGFIGFGILLTAGLIFKFRDLGRVNYPDGLIIAYGLSVLVTGFFCAAPIDKARRLQIFLFSLCNLSNLWMNKNHTGNCWG
jgi:hypothetical membrane protein